MVNTDEKSEEVIIPRHNIEDDFGATLLARDILGAFFAAGARPLVGRVPVVNGSDIIPDDYFGCWTSCFTFASLALSVAADADDQELYQDLQSIGWSLYSHTGLTSGALDHDAVKDAMARQLTFCKLADEAIVNDVFRWHYWSQAMANVVRQPQGWMPRRIQDMHEVDVKVGDCVWLHRLGLRYVRGTKGCNLILNDPGGGKDAEGFLVNGGFAVGIEAPGRPK